MDLRESLTIKPRTLKAGHVTLETRYGYAREMGAMLRFVDIMDHLDNHALLLIRRISWDEEHDTMSVFLAGDGLSTEHAQRVGRRMAKILWNLGGPTTVWIEVEALNYSWDFLNPAVTGAVA